jgi:ribosomal protein S18 acetylase RimI-like enzyme
MRSGATGFPGRSSTCRPGSRPWSSAADGCSVHCSAGPPGPKRDRTGPDHVPGGGYEDPIQQEVSNRAAPDQLGTYWFRSAEAADAARVAELVDAAYGHYVERIGMLPGPMTEDYAEVIRNRQVTVAERHGAIVGIIVLTVTDEGFLVDNVAVHPSQRGTGLGRALLEFAEAEARRAGFDSIYLYTHEQMTENLALYSRIGYVEYDRRCQGACSLVYLRKRLG